MGIKIKEKESGFNTEDFTDEWGLKKHFTKVHSDIKENITSDFILAKLSDNQKESITELVRDAYFCEKEISKLAKGWRYRLGKGGKYVRNEDYSFKRFPLEELEQKYIVNLGKITFNSYMIKIIMIVILYRNIDKNTLLELMTKRENIENENARLDSENATISEKVKDKLRNQEKEK